MLPIKTRIQRIRIRNKLRGPCNVVSLEDLKINSVRSFIATDEVPVTIECGARALNPIH